MHWGILGGGKGTKKATVPQTLRFRPIFFKNTVFFNLEIGLPVQVNPGSYYHLESNEHIEQ